MTLPFHNDCSRGYSLDHMQPADISMLPSSADDDLSGTNPSLSIFGARQLPSLQVQTQWPYMQRTHSVASGSVSIGASGSDYGLADGTSWVTTPNPRSESPAFNANMHNLTYAHTGGAGGPLSMDPFPAFDVNARPQQLAPEDLDSQRNMTPYLSGHDVHSETNLCFPANNGPLGTSGGHKAGHNRSVSAISLPASLDSCPPSYDFDGESKEDRKETAGKRKRRRLSEFDDGDAEKDEGPRFACPYQVVDRGLYCFQQGSRNVNGGCSNIFRLRQHFKRAHMTKYRCETCWRFFEKLEQLDEHRQKTCEVKRRKGTFMTPEQENEVEHKNRSRSDRDIRSPSDKEEACWWEMFRLLLPQYRDTDLETLKQRFSPYYNDQTIGTGRSASTSVGSAAAPAQDMTPVQFGHQANQYDISTDPMSPQFMAGMLSDPFEAQSCSQDTITPRHAGSLGDALSPGYGGVRPGYHHHHEQASGANIKASLSYVAYIRELASTGIEDPPRALESLKRIMALLPTLEQSIG